MAIQRKKAASNEIRTTKVRYPLDGEIPELQGVYFDVPSTVGNKKTWIESKWREENAKRVARDEAESRNAAVLADRKSQIIKEEAEALRVARSMELDLSAVKQELLEVQATVAAPDQAKIAEASQTAAALMGRVLDCSRDVAALAEKTEVMHAQAVETLERAAAERQAALDMASNIQQLMNGVQKSNGDLINQYSDRFVDAAKETQKLSEQIGQNWEIVQNAANINETAIAQAKTASQKMLEKQHEEFLGALSIALSAMGVTQEMLENELVRLNNTSYDKNQVALTPDYLRQMVQVTTQYRDARADMDRRTDEASAISAGSLQTAGILAAGLKTRPGYKKA